MRTPPARAAGQPAVAPARGGPGAVQVLLPVWGPHHVTQFLQTSLPTLLAPGNVPALAARLPCRFILMTRSEDADTIRRHPLWRQLGQVCDAQVRLINDLVSPGNHPVTLTLAYERAIRAAGAAMRETCFILLVADYLLSDGSLATVLAKMQAGASAVLTGTPQVVSEDALPWMRAQRRDGRGALALPAREVMRWVLEHLHPATAASFADFGATHNAQATRLFWRAGAEAMIGRFYLMHPVAVRPEVDDFTIGAACDYSFVPEMCPSGRVAILADSDDYLALEMQPLAAQAEHVRQGGYRLRLLARSLSEWTTAQHRDNVGHTLLFHAGPVGSSVTQATEAADRFIAGIADRLPARPQPYRDHPYWIGSMAIHRAATGADPARANVGGLEGLLWRLRFKALGHPPRVSCLHARWPEFHVLRRAVRARQEVGKRLCVVAPAPEAFAGWLRQSRSPIHAVSSQRLLDAPEAIATPAERYATCALIVPDGNIQSIGDLAARAGARLAPGGTMVVWFGNGLADAPSTLGEDTAGEAARLAASGLTLTSMRHVGWGGTRRTLQRAVLALARATRRNRMYLPLAAAAIPFLCAATALANLLALARRGPPRFGASSAVMLTLAAPAQPCAGQPRAAPTDAAMPPRSMALEGVAG